MSMKQVAQVLSKTALVGASALALVALALTIRSGLPGLTALGQLLVVVVYLGVIGSLIGTWMWVKHTRAVEDGVPGYWGLVLGPRPQQDEVRRLWWWGRFGLCCWTAMMLAMAVIALSGRLGWLQ